MLNQKILLIISGIMGSAAIIIFFAAFIFSFSSTVNFISLPSYETAHSVHKYEIIMFISVAIYAVFQKLWKSMYKKLYENKPEKETKNA